MLCRLSLRAVNSPRKKARAIARDACIFTFPQVYYYWYAYLQAIDATAGDYFGGLNVYMHFPL